MEPMNEVVCPHCGQRQRDPGHVAGCAWGVRPTKSEGYRYVVAVLTSHGEHPLIVSHTKTRAAAHTQARHAVTGRVDVYGSLEVRVVGFHGRVAERWVRDRRGKMRFTDVAQAVREATERGELGTETPAVEAVTGGLF